MASSKLQVLWNHPAGPKTTLLSKILARAASFPYESLGHGYGFRFTKFRSEIEQIKKRPLRVQNVHFWAPTFKWGISIANVADFSKPPEKLSYPQQIAVTCTGIIWSRYSTVITPKNWNLFSVNVAMATTGLYQLSRKIRHDYFSEPDAAVANDD